MLYRSLLERPWVLTDGATGTELQRRGLPPGECPDVWTLLNPDAVYEVARSYVEAGSDVILTTTFRANAISLAPYGLASKVKEINHAGAALARRAAAHTSTAVFGSIGPTGEMLAVQEDLREQVVGVFEEQATALAEGGVDALVLETFSDIEEARLALIACLNTGLPAIASFAFDAGRQKDRTMTGATPEKVAAAMEQAGASGVGANCGVGIESAIEICARLRANTSLPLWIKPNAGLPEMVNGQVVYRTSPEEFASRTPELVRAGAKFAGACCGSNPEFIRAMRKRLCEQVPAAVSAAAR